MQDVLLRVLNIALANWSIIQKAQRISYLFAVHRSMQ